MRVLFAIFGLLITMSTFASTDLFTFRDEAQEQQFRQLTAELRCPKCQNNSIADSNAMIATDMRQKVFELMQQGKSKAEIVDYMVARYGNFVTYNPPLTPLTLLLWVSPFAVIFVGGWLIFIRSRRQMPRTEAVPVDEPAVLSQTGTLWVLLPGVVIALACSAACYSLVGGFPQIRQWQQVSAETPALLERALTPDAKALDREEMARLGLGLRTRLQQDPENVEGLIMLGRVGMALGEADTAIQAFGRAYTQAPDNTEVAMALAEALTRSSDPDDARQGQDLLRQLINHNRTDVRALSVFAFNAFEQERYEEAIAAWQNMLQLLPAKDTRRGVIERSIAQAVALQAKGQ
mgnify:CR=1 FL=1